MADKRSKISIVFPVYNEEENLQHLYDEVKIACVAAQVDYEMIFVDDGSVDGSLGIIKGLASKDRGVMYVSFSRNFGHQISFFAGMTYAEGDAVITMDADLQHPPTLIPEMVNRWRAGADVVFTTKRDSKLPAVKGAIVRSAYWFISKLSGLQLEFGQSDFRLIDRKVLKTILQMPECHKFLRGQVRWVGFKQEGIPYDVGHRYAGTAKYSYKTLYDLALNGIFSFGRYPLHLVMIAGLFMFLFSSVYIFLLLIVWALKIFRIIRIAMPPGYTDIIMAVCFLGSVQLLSIGILSEYVGRIYEQTKARPIFIVKEDSRKASIGASS
jgi:dolichol-phosphate mannosyltransferase